MVGVSFQTEPANSMSLAVVDRHSDRINFSRASAAETAGVAPQCAPRVRIERKLFPHISDQPSFSTTSSVATSDSRDFSDQPADQTQVLGSYLTLPYFQAG